MMRSPVGRSAKIRQLVHIAAMLLWLILSASAALAHAGLVASDPVDGAVLKTAPRTLSLTFTEPVTPLVFTLLSADGARRDLSGATATDLSVTLDLPDGLMRGTHLLTWRAVSADGHPVSGTLAFSVGAPGALPPAATGGDVARTAAIWLTRATLSVLIFGAVGALLFAAAVAPLPPRHLSAIGNIALLGVPLVGISLGLQGLDALGLGLDGLFSPRPFAAGFGTSFGGTAIAASLAFLATFAASRVSPRHRIGLVILATGAAALAPMLSGHAGTAPPTFVSKPAILLHVLGLIFWLGSLLPLAVLLTRNDSAADRALARFSRIVPFAVLLIVASGLVLAALQMGPPNPAWLTGYGLLLGTKLLLLAPLFAVALANRLWLTRPVLSGDDTARRRLRLLVIGEILLVLLVLCVVAGWRFTPPPRVVAEIAARPAHTHIHTDAAMADLALTPGHAGPAELSLWLMDGTLAPLAPRSVTVTLSSTALGIERLERPARHDEDGFWRVPLVLPAGGTWNVALAIRVDDFTMLQLSGELEVNP